MIQWSEEPPTMPPAGPPPRGRGYQPAVPWPEPPHVTCGQRHAPDTPCPLPGVTMEEFARGMDQMVRASAGIPPIQPVKNAVIYQLVQLPAAPPRPARRREGIPMSRHWIVWMIAVYVVVGSVAPPAVGWWFSVVMAAAFLRAALTPPR